MGPFLSRRHPGLVALVLGEAGDVEKGIRESQASPRPGWPARHPRVPSEHDGRALSSGATVRAAAPAPRPRRPPAQNRQAVSNP